jgi:hypothetical protein
MPGISVNPSFIRNIVIKTIVLLGLCNLAYGVLQPIDILGRISAYNVIFPGRLRFPFGERPDLSYNLTINSLEAMFSAHEIDGSPKQKNEYRVLLIGDSSVWGYLLPPQDTLSGIINRSEVSLADGRIIQSFNLGYPTLSLTKDLLIMQQATRYEPDLIIWLVTLESFLRSKQLDSPLLKNNPQKIVELVQELDLQVEMPPFWYNIPPWWQRTIFSQRRELADLFRLQLYGVLWAATGIDQAFPAEYELPSNDLDNTIEYGAMLPPVLDLQLVAFDLLQSGQRLAGEIPLFIVNEPIFRGTGANREIRYNFFYPRWAYDQYRMQMERLSQVSGWHYLDAWELVDPSEFTNSAIHISPAGSQQLAKAIVAKIILLEGSTSSTR